MKLPFRPGDQVVCINDSKPRTCNDAPDLDLGFVYTVEACFWGTRASDGFSREAGVTLIGFAHLDSDVAWLASRFEAAA